MEKYYWNPTRDDRIGVCMGIFAEDNLQRGDVEVLVDSFPGQSIDFFGALRARVYDDKVSQQGVTCRLSAKIHLCFAAASPGHECALLE
jgi:hypothetical protein